MNVSSYTPDQLVNLIENTILKQGYDIDDFTGGSVQITATISGVEKYKVRLFFGYDEKRNSVSSTIPIKAEHSDLWYTAIKTYVAINNSLKLGHDMDDLNALMNTKKESDVKKKVEVVGIGIGKVGGYEVVGKVNGCVTTSLRKGDEFDNLWKMHSDELKNINTENGNPRRNKNKEQTADRYKVLRKKYSYKVMAMLIRHSTEIQGVSMLYNVLGKAFDKSRADVLQKQDESLLTAVLDSDSKSFISFMDEIEERT